MDAVEEQTGHVGVTVLEAVERFERARRDTLRPVDDAAVLYGWHTVTAALRNPARRWYDTLIPIVFHCVLATFLLVPALLAFLVGRDEDERARGDGAAAVVVERSRE